MLSRYLADELDGRLGLAEGRFRQFLAEQKTIVEPAAPAPRRWQVGRWSSVAGTALAASLATLWVGPALRQPTAAPAPSTPAPPPTLVSDPVLVQQDVQSQTFDDGPTLLEGNIPVRVLHRRDLQRTRWFDENQNIREEQVVPEDHVVYVQMKTY